MLQLKDLVKQIWSKDVIEHKWFIQIKYKYGYEQDVCCTIQIK